jgi:hypothetical protein
MSKVIAPASLVALAGRHDFSYYDEVRRLQAEAKASGPQVGMPATFSIGSDSYATEVTAVSPSGKTVTTKDHGDFTLRKGGRYLCKGQKYGGLYLGYAVEHLDPSF